MSTSHRIPQPNRYNPRDKDNRDAMYKSGSGRFVTFAEWKKLRDRVEELEDTLETRELLNKVLSDETHQSR